MGKYALQWIELHRHAPEKPDYAAPCNGCGVCCAAEPCPVAHVFLLQFKGKCRALLWQEDRSRYMCGMVAFPDRYVKLIPGRFRARQEDFLLRVLQLVPDVILQ